MLILVNEFPLIFYRLDVFQFVGTFQALLALFRVSLLWDWLRNSLQVLFFLSFGWMGADNVQLLRCFYVHFYAAHSVFLKIFTSLMVFPFYIWYILTLFSDLSSFNGLLHLYYIQKKIYHTYKIILSLNWSTINWSDLIFKNSCLLSTNDRPFWK